MLLCVTLYGTDVRMVTANMAGMYDCLIWNCCMVTANKAGMYDLIWYRCMVTANMAHMYDPLVVGLHSLCTRKW